MTRETSRKDHRRNRQGAVAGITQAIRNDREKLKTIGLSALHSVVLINIYRYPGLNQNELAQLISIDKATVSRILNSLEPREYIERPPEPGNGATRSFGSRKGARPSCGEHGSSGGRVAGSIEGVPQAERVRIMRGSPSGRLFRFFRLKGRMVGILGGCMVALGEFDACGDSIIEDYKRLHMYPELDTRKPRRRSSSRNGSTVRTGRPRRTGHHGGDRRPRLGKARENNPVARGHGRP
jgi:hypothetical protein